MRTSERRPDPTTEDRKPARYFGHVVTVTCEEHYQPQIESSMPKGQEQQQKEWEFLAELAMAGTNPHSKHDGSCVEVRYDQRTIGYLTLKASERFVGVINTLAEKGDFATIKATASLGTKGGHEIWRVKLHLD